MHYLLIKIILTPRVPCHCFSVVVQELVMKLRWKKKGEIKGKTATHYKQGKVPSAGCLCATRRRQINTLNDAVLSVLGQKSINWKIGQMFWDGNVFEMHSKTECTSLLWRSMVDQHSKNNNKDSNPLQHQLSMNEELHPFPNNNLDSVFYFIQAWVISTFFGYNILSISAVKNWI